MAGTLFAALWLAACAVPARPQPPRPPSPGVPLSVWHLDTLVDTCEPWWVRPATLCKGQNVKLEWDSCRWRCQW